MVTVSYRIVRKIGYSGLKNLYSLQRGSSRTFSVVIPGLRLFCVISDAERNAGITPDRGAGLSCIPPSSRM